MLPIGRNRAVVIKRFWKDIYNRDEKQSLMRYLIDRDGVLADFERSVLETYRERHPDKPFVPPEQRSRFFYMEQQYPEDCRPLLREIYNAQHFFRDLPLITGATDALGELEQQGNEVFICTSPLLSNPYCISEKLEWIERQFSHDWVDRTIFIKDKTIILADFLIDDRPEVTGVQQPTWEHILYTQPYNRDVSGKRRLTWQDWRTVLR